MSWIHPSFDDTSGARGNRTMARTRGPTLFGMAQSTGTIWCDEYEPQQKEDLAVNRRKIEEVETWLRNALSGRLGRAPIALLSGPSGSGKTATVKVLSACMGFTIKEWITPGKVATFKEEYEGSGKIWYESQIVQFEEYLFRASRYPSLMMSNEHSKFVVLVEDIPNVYINDTSLLEKTLQKFSEFAFCPMILICSTGPPEFNLERMIFKDKMIKELKISKISFNPAAKKLLKNAIKRIIQKGRKKNVNVFQKVAEELIDEAVEMSNCDIRSTINQFQYILCGKPASKRKAEFTDLKASSSVAKKKAEVAEVKARPLVGRDEFHDVFRYLGRVLYCKRVNVSDKEGGVPKERFLYNPDEIVGSVSSVPNLFLNLLNENYISIFTDMKKISEATDYITYSDVLMAKWTERDTEVYYSLYLSVLGLMKCSNVGIKRTWLPLRSSKIKHALAACEEKMNKCMLYFPEKLGERRVLMNELLPYYAKLDLSDTEEDKKKFIRSFTGWKSRGFRFSPADDSDIVEDLNETHKPSSSEISAETCIAKTEGDEVQEDITDENTPGVSLEEEEVKFLTPPLEEEEDAYIEEYDSE